MNTPYFRPIVQRNVQRSRSAVALAGGPLWFDHVCVMQRDEAPHVIGASDLPSHVLDSLSGSRPSISDLSFDRPRIMAILNATPDSFSDGGQFFDPKHAVAQARQFMEDGADILDIGGESTRPGSQEVPVDEEIKRTRPIMEALCGQLDGKAGAMLSSDTRKAKVAEMALECGAGLINDVSGFTFDPQLAPLCAERKAAVCVMHSQGLPDTMQDNPRYENVVLDVFDTLEVKINELVDLGIPRSRIIADPGIGFGKTIDHNLAILQNISVFHNLGVVLMLGVSRKGFIGKVTGEPNAMRRAFGSVSTALAAAAQGVQIFRVHDVKETRQAFDMWQILERGKT